MFSVSGETCPILRGLFIEIAPFPLLPSASHLSRRFETFSAILSFIILIKCLPERKFHEGKKKKGWFWGCGILLYFQYLAHSWNIVRVQWVFTDWQKPITLSDTQTVRHIFGFLILESQHTFPFLPWTLERSKWRISYLTFLLNWEPSNLQMTISCHHWIRVERCIPS